MVKLDVRWKQSSPSGRYHFVMAMTRDQQKGYAIIVDVSAQLQRCEVSDPDRFERNAQDVYRRFCEGLAEHRPFPTMYPWEYAEVDIQALVREITREVAAQ